MRKARKQVVPIADKDKEFPVTKHLLVPKHSKVSETERKRLLEQYKISVADLPRISMKDPAIAHLDLEPDAIVRIERPSHTSKNAVFYRRVVK